MSCSGMPPELFCFVACRFAPLRGERVRLSHRASLQPKTVAHGETAMKQLLTLSQIQANKACA